MTGSDLEAPAARTAADLAASAAAAYGDATAVRYKRDGEWRELSYGEVGTIVEEIALGLIDLGIAARRPRLHPRRHEPRVDLREHGVSAAGAVVVPIYPTNSPEECEWVVGNSEARAIVCENEAQLAKIEKVRDNLPALSYTIGIEPGGGDVTLDELRERGRGGDDARSCGAPGGDRARATPTRSSTRPGTTGPPKGCVLTHANAMSVCTMARAARVRQPATTSATSTCRSPTCSR